MDFEKMEKLYKLAEKKREESRGNNEVFSFWNGYCQAVEDVMDMFGRSHCYPLKGEAKPTNSYLNSINPKR